MAKQRIVNTKYWDDKYIRSLNSNGKLLFIYLFTNSLATIAGCYEITLDRIYFDTGIRRGEILNLLEKFSKDDKATFQDDWLMMHNTVKHQTLTNVKIVKGIEESVKDCPDWIKHRLSIAYHWLSHLNLNLNLNSNPNSNTNAGNRPVVRAIPISEKEQIFFNDLLDGLRTSLGVTILRHEQLWVEAGEWAYQNKFTVEQFLECFDLLRAQDWRKSPVKPDHVTDNLPNLAKLIKGESPGQPNSTPSRKQWTARDQLAYDREQERLIFEGKLDATKIVTID